MSPPNSNTQGLIASAFCSMSTQEQYAALEELSSLDACTRLPDGVMNEIARLLGHPSLEVQCKAMQCLGSMEKAGARFSDQIAWKLTSEDTQVCCFAASSLGMMGESAKKHAPKLRKLITHADPNVRAVSVLAMGTFGFIAAIDMVVGCLEDPSPDVVEAAIASLTLIGPAGSEHADKVVEKLACQTPNIAVAVLSYLSAFPEQAFRHGRALSDLLASPDSKVRHAVVQTVLGLEDQTGALLDAVAAVLISPDPRSKCAAVVALGSMKEAAKEYAPEVAKLLSDTSEDLHPCVMRVAGIYERLPASLRIPACAAMEFMATMEDTTYAAQIAALLGEAHPTEVREAAIAAVISTGVGNVEVLLEPLLEAPQASLRQAAALAYGRLALRCAATAEMAESVAAGLTDPVPCVRAATCSALGSMGEEGSAFSEAIFDLFSDRSLTVRLAAVRAMPGLGVKGQLYAPEIARILQDSAPLLRQEAAAALSKLGARGTAFADEVAELLSDVDATVRAAAAAALSLMGEDARPFAGDIAKLQQDEVLDVREAARLALKVL